MAHYAQLTGCPDRTTAERYEFKAIWADAGPELVARYAFPLFWLAGFGPEDEVVTRYPFDASEEEREELLLLCAPVREFVARLERRRGPVLALVGDALFAPYYDEWIRFVRQRYPRCLLLRTEDIFAMSGFPESAAQLRRTLQALAPADRGEPIRDVDAVDWFAAQRGLLAERQQAESAEAAAARWRAHLAGSGYTESGTLIFPARPLAPEIAAAAALPEAAAGPDAALTTLVRTGRQPGSVKGRLQLALDKLTGAAPAGIDAPNKPLRKLIGATSVVLDVVRTALVVAVLGPVGGAMLYVGFADGVDLKLAGLGALLLAIGAWAARRFLRAVRELRAILRA